MIDTNPDNLMPETPEVASDVQPESTETIQEVQQQPEPPKESSEQRNFRNLREKAERIQRERDEALIRLRQYEEAQKVEPESLNLKPDDLAEGKHINKVESRIKDLEKQLMETRLRTQYPDIDNVVNDTTLSIIKEKYPHLARTIGSSKDFYDQAISAYTIIKEMGIYQEPAPFDSDKAIALRNSNKPKPLASVSPQQGDSPLSKANAFANGLTDELKRQLYKEMMDAKNRS